MKRPHKGKCLNYKVKHFSLWERLSGWQMQGCIPIMQQQKAASAAIGVGVYSPAPWGWLWHTFL